jgi:hypothetical protein
MSERVQSTNRFARAHDTARAGTRGGDSSIQPRATIRAAGYRPAALHMVAP